jgi:hypothetical protein
MRLDGQTDVTNLMFTFRNFANAPKHLMIYYTDRQGGAVVKVLCYKSEGRWFDPRWCQWNFSLA